MNSDRMWSFTAGSAKVSLRQSAGLKTRRLRGLFHGIGKRATSQKESLGSAFAVRSNVLAPTVDHGLAAVGIAAAIGSAVFAGYMLTHEGSRPVFGGAEHLRLFAQPLDSRWRRMPIAGDRVDGRPVDYNATGSIRHGGVAAAGVVESKGEASATSADGKSRAAQRDMVLGGYVVRFVHKGLAIVQGRKGSYAVAPGVTLPEVGRVLSIQKRESGWVVVTAKGLITERAF